jgi:predicted extracellular nuclease
LASGDYYVVCANAATVANCDLDVDPDTNLIQNGAPDAVGLRFDGQLIDAVSYEGDTGTPYTEGSGTGLVDDGSEGTSISRCPDGQDTNQNNADFVLAPSTPGTENNCPPPEVCGDPFTPIYEVQGSGSASPLVGSEVAVEGIVVGDFQNNTSLDNGDLNGFHLQDPTGDGDPATSDGIFVFAPGGIDVSVGDSVRVRGAVSEFNGMTEIGGVSLILQCTTGNSLPPPAEVELPVISLDDFERYEGMYVTFPQALVISEYFNYERFGEIVLALPLDGESRPFTPTAIDEPGAPALERALANSIRRITLDDGLTTQNPPIVRHPNGEAFSLTNRFRGGDTVESVTGVIDFSFGLYRIQPTGPADYSAVNPRTEAPEEVGGSLKVASFNVLNYFLSPDNIQEASNAPDNPADNICGPGLDQECRGFDGDQPEEFNRQRTKILAALFEIDGDIVGLIEMENTFGVEPMEDIVAGLNQLYGAVTYDFITTGTIGTDAIKVGIIYKPASVTPVGDYAILDTTVDPRFLDEFNRPVLAQTFREEATGGIFTVAVNHLKSKGSDCDDIGDPDLGDGQGNCNQTRVAAAEALVDWLASDPTGSGDADALIIGDLNSYDKEDPIDVLLAGGYTDLLFKYLGEFAYSYVFDGQSGYLDHALANPTLAAQVTGATVWHINADEPDLLDYDTTFKPPAQEAIYEPNAYRSSDHDPVIVGLDLLHYDWDGFFPPISNPPVLNEANAGSNVPVKFSLSGDQGLEVFFTGYPVSMQIDCQTGEQTGTAEETITAGNSSLTYDLDMDQYTYPWKTDKGWANICRRLVVILDDGSIHFADFHFTK